MSLVRFFTSAAISYIVSSDVGTFFNIWFTMLLAFIFVDLMDSYISRKTKQN